MSAAVPSEAVATDPADLPVVFACDVGSVSAGACHWAQDGVDGHASGDLAAFAGAVVAALTAGRRVAIGVECPLFFPCPDDPRRLGRARRGDCVPGVGNRPYSASAGAGSTVAGVPILCWLLRAVRDRVPRVRCTTDFAAFAQGEADVLIWEAFVSGPARGPHHLDDAIAAVAEFVTRWRSGTLMSDAGADAPISLAAAALLWAGMSDDVALLRQACLVVRPPTPPPGTTEQIAAVPILGRIEGVALFREHDWRRLLWLRPDPDVHDFDRATGYALSIHGSAAVGDSVTYAQVIKRVRRKDGTFNGKFVALRVALFFLQRSLKWAETSMHDRETRAEFAACHAALCEAWAREARWHVADAVAADREARVRLGLPAFPNAAGSSQAV